MDVVRKHAKRNKRIRRGIFLVLSVVAIGFVSGALARLEPAAPSVPRQSVVIDSVKRGTMLRQVRAPGNLIPVDSFWKTATTNGRITALPLKPGTPVEPDTVILKMTNPELDKEEEDAKWAYLSAQAELEAAKEQLENQQLDLQGALEEIKAACKEAELQRDVDEQLYGDKLISGQKYKLSQGRCEHLDVRVKIAEAKTKNFEESIKPQLEVQRAKVAQAGALYKLRQKQVEDLTIRAEIKGILLQLGESPEIRSSSQTKPLALGQWVLAGASLAMVTDPQNLQAELKVPEVQARYILLGQSVEVDARVATIPGKVVRIDPASHQGTVAVDVQLEGELPNGARPDLSVNGTILIERLDDVLYTGRILYGEPGSTVSLFVLAADGLHAERTKVTLGRSSVHTIEIVAGLNVGNEVVISDMKRWEDYDRIRLQ